MPGDYVIPFEFTLPLNLPSSINYKNNIGDKPKAKIKHTIKAIINMKNGKIMKYKQLLVIHENPVEFKQDANSNVTVDLNTWCCIN